jgi:hypothetical protein
MVKGMDTRLPEIMRRLDDAYIVEGDNNVKLCLNGEILFTEPITKEDISTPRKFVAYMVKKIRK